LTTAATGGALDVRDTLQAWTGVRCATPSRLPAVGPVHHSGEPPQGAGLWVCSGLGSRGLTFAGLCAELLAARLQGEPLPVTQRLADALLPVFEGHGRAAGRTPG
jgi:tRNA 5-methylaminomethyl-2-thiouridine biosynthesis bifunctional protein